LALTFINPPPPFGTPPPQASGGKQFLLYYLAVKYQKHHASNSFSQQGEGGVEGLKKPQLRRLDHPDKPCDDGAW